MERIEHAYNWWAPQEGRPEGARDVWLSQTAADAGLFKAVGDPARVRILSILMLREDGFDVEDVASYFNLTQSTISHHLGILRKADLVRYENRRGGYHVYSLSDYGRVLTALLAYAPPRRRR